MFVKGIYQLDGEYGPVVQVNAIDTFLSTLPDGTLRFRQLDFSCRPKFVGSTWNEVITPNLRDPFAYGQWANFAEDTIKWVYKDLMDEFSDDLDESDPYAEDESDLVLPWNDEVQTSAQRVILRYLLDSDWAQARDGQEKAIAFCTARPAHDRVQKFHKLLFQSVEITDYTKHRKAHFLASTVQELMEQLVKYRKGKHNAKVRSRSRAKWGGQF